MKGGRSIEARFAGVVPVPLHEVLQAIGVLAGDMGQTAYLVGGIVRDLALGRDNVDLDIVVEGDAQRLAGAFARKTGSFVKGRTRFGTCKVESKAFGTIDMAGARSESYRHPGALPDTTKSGLDEDLARRDFSINAMAICLAPERYGRLLDPFGGAGDISEGKIRVLHAESFRDDPTRILRGVRFAARYGFTFERKTLALLRTSVEEGCFDSISGKRIYTELKLICMEEHVFRAMFLLGQYMIIWGLDPDLRRSDVMMSHKKHLPEAVERVTASAGEGFAETWVCWFASFFMGLKKAEAGRLAERFNIPRRVRESCLWVSDGLPRSRAELARMKKPAAYGVTRLLRQVPPEGLVNLFAGSERRERNLILSYLTDWRHVAPALTGDRIVALGVTEGPVIGQILDGILKLKLRGRLASRQDEIAYVKRRMSRWRSSGGGK